jgi:hypothetical protein
MKLVYNICSETAGVVYRLAAVVSTAVLRHCVGSNMNIIFVVKARVTLLAVYRQSFRLGDKPLETHDQIFYFSNLTLAVIFFM